MSNPLPNFHILARPAGAAGNLDCQYDPHLAGQENCPGSGLRMDEGLLEQYIRQCIEAQAGDVVTIAWQGGEPMLMGLDFYRRAVALAQQYARPGVTVEHAIQTNGALLDDAWCEFLRANDFLVGLSIDGPQAMHDAYRMDKDGCSTHAQALAAAALLRKHKVDFNVLTCVHAANAGRPLEVYRFLRDEVGSEWVQFTPIVERVQGRTIEDAGGSPAACAPVSERSVTAWQWGEFLCAVYDEWVRCDVGRMYVNLFEAALAAWLGAPPPLCIFRRTCGDVLALEPNGDVHSCNRFIEQDWLLGNIRQQPLLDLVTSSRQQQFGAAKAVLPEQCRACPVRFACQGECPKNRFVSPGAGEPPLNYLCAGYFKFFTHIDRTMRVMAQLYRMSRAPAEVMAILAAEDARWRQASAALRRSAPCPCGSGKKVKQCHGQA